MSAHIGGKAATLGELIRLGIRCPDGIVLSTKLFDEHCRSLGLGNPLEDGAEATEQELKQARAVLLRSDLPDDVVGVVRRAIVSDLPYPLLAVRSSATVEDSKVASFAGSFQTLLGVRNSLESVSQGIKRCWASVFTACASGYLAATRRQGKPLPGPISMAVVIQQLISATTSGVVVTSLPGQDHEMLIEAGFGLSVVVDGVGLHDKYFIDKDSGRLVRTVIHAQDIERIVENDILMQHDVEPERSTQMKLTEEIIREIVQTALFLESHLSAPLSIEFAAVGQEVWITQARPLPQSTVNVVAIAQNLHGTW
jgi:phosphoenolpyruvate synthase/pyruvate phosphate dikinase